MKDALGKKQYINWENGKIKGQVIEYHKNGTLYFVLFMKNGKIDKSKEFGIFNANKTDMSNNVFSQCAIEAGFNWEENNWWKFYKSSWGI